MLLYLKQYLYLSKNLITTINQVTIMDTFEKLGTILKPHAVLTSMGLTSERALEIVNNRNLTFTPKYMSLTETFRAQLKAIAESVDVNINAILNMLTTEQLKDVAKGHKHIKWHHPKIACNMTLSGITKSPLNEWVLEFQLQSLVCFEVFKLHDLEIHDVLAFLATVENVMDATNNVLLNS